jgi:hypothetical protein
MSCFWECFEDVEGAPTSNADQHDIPGVPTISEG